MFARMIPEYCVNPITLTFDQEMEAAFQEDYYQKSLPNVRFSAALGTFFYIIFGLLDYLLIPRVLDPIWYIRYAIVTPFLILILILTWSKSFKPMMQVAMASYVLVAGLGIIAMTVIAYPPGQYYYYAGLILVITFGYTLVAARFVYASIAGWTIVIVYEIVALAISHTPAIVLISNSFFFISASIIGMIACYQIELFKRTEFCQRTLLEKEQVKTRRLLTELNNELLLASEIQKSLLPAPVLNWQEYEAVFYCKPTLDIGGDFYSYHFIDRDCLALAVGDASGHGIPAALMMAATLSLFDSSFSLSLNPCERLSFLDLGLLPYCEKRHQNCAFCYVEVSPGHLYVADAGGIPPLIRSQDGSVQRIQVGGFPLGHGLGAEIGYIGIETPLAKGDTVVIVTDGAIEARNAYDSIFSFSSLELLIASAPNGNAHTMLDHLVSNISSFIDQNRPQDDFTIAVLHYSG